MAREDTQLGSHLTVRVAHASSRQPHNHDICTMVPAAISIVYGSSSQGQQTPAPSCAGHALSPQHSLPCGAMVHLARIHTQCRCNRSACSGCGPTAITTRPSPHFTGTHPPPAAAPSIDLRWVLQLLQAATGRGADEPAGPRVAIHAAAGAGASVAGIAAVHALARPRAAAVRAGVHQPPLLCVGRA